jgi:hypothetical protein
MMTWKYVSLGVTGGALATTVFFGTRLWKLVVEKYAVMDPGPGYPFMMGVFAGVNVACAICMMVVAIGNVVSSMRKKLGSGDSAT